jgi:hypothetical protein
MVQMVRESAENDYLANSGDFMREFEVSRRTVVYFAAESLTEGVACASNSFFPR